jgi:segregation and condensation protein B
VTSELDEPRATPDDAAPEPGSLADRLANWTPSWTRPEPTAPPAPPEDAAADDAPERVEDAERSDEPAAGVEPAADSAQPAADSAGPAADSVETPEYEPPARTEEPAAPSGPEPAEADGPAGDAAVVDGPEPGADMAEQPVVPADEAAVPGGAPEPVEDGGSAVGEPESDAGEMPELDDPVLLRGAVEAMLMVVDEPVADHVLAEAVQRPLDVVQVVLRELAEEYTAQRRGFELRQAAGGWRIYTRDEFAAYVERFVLEGQQVRLTQAALETLAVVAYKQPVSRSRVSAIRGVNCDGVIRTLLTRGLIEECGTEPESGAHLYRTSMLFLERMGINSVDELPELAPFLPDDLPEEA